VGRLAVDHDVELVGRSIDRPDAGADHPTGHLRLHVAADDGTHLVLGEELGGDDVLCTRGLRFLARLEQRDQADRQVLDATRSLQQQPQRGEVHVVPAGVHGPVRRSPLHAGALGQRQRVQLCTDRHGRSGRSEADKETGVGDAGGAQVRQHVAEALGRWPLRATQVGVAVQFPAQGAGMQEVLVEVLHQLCQQSGRRRVRPGSHHAPIFPAVGVTRTAAGNSGR